METSDRDLNDRDTLISIGLLPNPDGYAEPPMVAGRTIEDPLVEEYRIMAGRLSQQVTWAKVDADNTRDQIYLVREDRARAVRALNWLREVYKLDDLALEVIGYAINGPIGSLDW